MANKYSDTAIKMNFLVKPLLRSPLHWLLSSSVALIRFTGRKSGKQFETPVAFTKFDGEFLICLTETRDRQWWRNYRKPWPMALKYKTRWLEGEACWLEPGSEAYRANFERVFRRVSFTPRIYKIYDFDAEQGLTDAQLQILLNNGSGIVQFLLKNGSSG
ncbi:nitroreductase/quinone reductase family protein [Litorivivens sp.]|uniref:nitroreductase/quinone reductase family protein n=1 Tax=Litorivivens sp. TaxID=2020868 RepID=UPI0035699FA8